jgi:hypothetical protein
MAKMIDEVLDGMRGGFSWALFLVPLSPRRRRVLEWIEARLSKGDLP